MTLRLEYFATYNKRRLSEPEYQRANRERVAKHWRVRKATETPEQRRERLLRDKIRRALRENARKGRP
jgi:hypothetical protein